MPSHSGASYVPLGCKSHYSFLEGASSPEELCQEAAKLGLPGIGITDRDGVYGLVRAHVAAKGVGLPLHIGASIHIGNDKHLRLLVQNAQGYANLCHLISLGRLRSPKGESQVSLREVCEHARGLLCLANPTTELVDAFGEHLYVPIARHRRESDAKEERILRSQARRFSLPLAAVNHTYYHRRERQALHDVLTCVRHKRTLQTIGTRISPNAEHALLSAREFTELFRDDPEACKNTLRIGEACSYSLDEIEYRYPSEVGQGATSAQELRRLSVEGMHEHFGDSPPAEVLAQLEKELKVIGDLDYGGYFLTMYEIVQFCRRENILCQGRGSAANSLVCFCLGVTAVNPAEMDLLFERFLSKERAEPPDIDLDIEHNRREEVIQHVYDKYGRDHAAMVCNFIRYRPKSALRDVGKALGIPEVHLAQASKLLSRYDTVDPEVLTAAGMDPESHSFEKLVTLANELLGFPRHISIHPGGFLLGHAPVHTIVPIENGTMADRTVIQWDKEDIEALQLFKVDLLGLGALHHVHRAFDLVREHRGIDLEMKSIPQGCQETYAMMQRADTIGVFQIESRAQMSMLPRLRPACFYDLVIEISLVRPGPITGGMVHPYLRRRRGEEEISYPHPSLEPVLQKTLGVPLFQEQVMKLAMVAADYTPGEADQLRRDMAAWRQKGHIERHRETLITRMCSKGIAQEFAERVFDQICGFGEYGFPESHAASFALIAYVTSWLKWHYHAEFSCALLNSLPMGFYSAATIVGDAQRHGIKVRPIDVNQSSWDCTLEPAHTDHSAANDSANTEFAIRMGLRFVKGLSEEHGRKIERIRQMRAFGSIDEFRRRAVLDHKAYLSLADSGAFRCFGNERRNDLWQVYELRTSHRDSLPLPESAQHTSFPAISPLDETLWDMQSSQHSTKGHPLRYLRSQLQKQGFPTARQISQSRDRKRVQYAGVVICRQRPGTAGGVTFMTLEDETGFVNLVVWKDVFQAHKAVAKTASLLAVSGEIQNQEGIVHLIAQKLWQPRVHAPSIAEQSRDFR